MCAHHIWRKAGWIVSALQHISEMHKGFHLPQPVDRLQQDSETPIMSCSPSFFPKDRVLAFHVITPRSVNSCNQHCSLHAGWIPAEALAPTIHRSPVPNTVTARRMPHFQGREEDSAEWATYDRCFPDTRQKWMKRGEQIKVEKVAEG
ncbi:unnamed protein product [Leuciscus chuanchicus]